MEQALTHLFSTVSQTWTVHEPRKLEFHKNARLTAMFWLQTDERKMKGNNVELKQAKEINTFPNELPNSTERKAAKKRIYIIFLP